MFIDIDCTQAKKYNQNANGDYFLSKRNPEIGRIIAVLSDGLGSGIKANILSCMTATMLLRFIEEDIHIRKSAEIIMNSLPVCKVRKISYSTFSAIDCDEQGNAKIVEEGNPEFVWMRGSNVISPEFKIIESKKFTNRKMKVYKLKLELGDRLIFCSDGVTQAGLGNGVFKLGLRREGLMQILTEKLANDAYISSTHLSEHIVNQAINVEPGRSPKDDISACVLYFREPRQSLVFTGPPYRQEKDSEYAKIFDQFQGKKAICGGTTADLLSRELHKPVTTLNRVSIGALPACSSMDGVDLVTEGILTLTKALEYLEAGIFDINNAATKLAKFFLDSDVITFMVGAKLNQAHYDPALPIEIEIRKNIIKKMTQVLQSKYFKKIYVQYM